MSLVSWRRLIFSHIVRAATALSFAMLFGLIGGVILHQALSVLDTRLPSEYNAGSIAVMIGLLVMGLICAVETRRRPGLPDLEQDTALDKLLGLVAGVLVSVALMLPLLFLGGLAADALAPVPPDFPPVKDLPQTNNPLILVFIGVNNGMVALREEMRRAFIAAACLTLMVAALGSWWEWRKRRSA